MSAVKEAEMQGAQEGVEIAPGVRFSEKLWSRLGSKAQEMERQQRRNRMGDTKNVPDVPTAIFDHVFRSDATWKQRELRLRRSYLEHLENLTLQKDDEKEALRKSVVQQVTGVYKLAEDDAVQRLAAHTKELQAKTFRRGEPQVKLKCQPETATALKCYTDNQSNPLACWKMVEALERCAAQARQHAVSSLPE